MSIDETTHIANSSGTELIEELHEKYDPLAKTHDYSLLFQVESIHNNEVRSVRLEIKDNRLYRLSQNSSFHKLSEELPKVIVHKNKNISLIIQYRSKSLIESIYERYVLKSS
jgi:hypothetical protein